MPVFNVGFGYIQQGARPERALLMKRMPLSDDAVLLVLPAHGARLRASPCLETKYNVLYSTPWCQRCHLLKGRRQAGTCKAAERCLVNVRWWSRRPACDIEFGYMRQGEQPRSSTIVEPDAAGRQRGGAGALVT